MEGTIYKSPTEGGLELVLWKRNWWVRYSILMYSYLSISWLIFFFQQFDALTLPHFYIFSFLHFYIFIFLHFYIFTFLHFYIFTFLHFYIFSFFHFFIFTFLHFYIFSFLHCYVFMFSYFCIIWEYISYHLLLNCIKLSNTPFDHYIYNWSSIFDIFVSYS